MTEPVVIIGELQELTAALDTASKVLYLLQEEFDTAAEIYDDVFNDLLVALMSKYEDEGKRLPGEDVRNAIVTKQMREDHAVKFGSYRRLKAELDRGERRAKRIQAQISAKQSVLSMLKTEMQAVGA